MESLGKNMEDTMEEIIKGLAQDRHKDQILFLLIYLANHNKPGGFGWPGWRNRFVFTCRSGWIDMGHFFRAALAGYWLGVGRHVPGFLTALDDVRLAELGERQQIWPEDEPKKEMETDVSPYGPPRELYLKGDLETLGKKYPGWTPKPSYESYMTPEDIPSNTLGLQFGKRLAQNPVSFQAFRYEWGRILGDNHAVIYYEKKGNPYETLKQDALNWWHAYAPIPDGADYEDPKALYTGDRLPWGEIKCQSEAFRDLCCCGSKDKAACQRHVSEGTCQATVPCRN